MTARTVHFSRWFWAALLALVLCAFAAPASAGDPLALYQKIADPAQRLNFRSIIAPPEGGDMVFYWKGFVYVDIPGDIHRAPFPGAPGNYYAHGGGQGGTPLFGFEGYNIRRVVPFAGPDGREAPGDFVQASREIVFFTDPKSGAVIDAWKNPFTGKTVPVYPITNEFLWDRYRVGTYEKDAQGGFLYDRYIGDGKLRSVIEANLRLPSGCAVLEADAETAPPASWADRLNWSFAIYPSYRLDDCGRYGIRDPMNLKNARYTTDELFSFWVPEWALAAMRWELRGGRKTRLMRSWLPPVTLNWTRVGPWSPWMCLDEAAFAGRVVYTVQSALLPGYEALPAEFRAKMKAYFDAGAQGLQTIGLMDGDGDGWEKAPSAYNPAIRRDTSFSVFHDKVLAPLGLTLAEWCAQSAR
jgi:hypothetical protein